MKGNHNDGMGLETAATKLVSWWHDILRCRGEIRGFFDDEFNRIISQMRKRANIERAKQKGGKL